jgi:drug/metabolite transporter (DMT)-like permease
VSWIAVTIFAYFINAGVYIADKFMLSRRFHSSIAYAFFVGIWSVLNFVLLAFAPYVPSPAWLLVDLSAGALFLFTIVFWYKALHQSEATRVVPIVGALTPIFTLILSTLFLGEVLDQKSLIAFLILISGGVLISIKNTKMHLWQEIFERVQGVLGRVHARYQPTRRLIVNSVISALFFALYNVLIKFIYMHEPFMGSFVWSRLGTFLAVLAMLLIPQWRNSISDHQHSGVKKQSSLVFFLIVRFLAAMAFIMINWAISLGNVAMVQVMQGTQYLFLIVIVALLSRYLPKVYNEELGRGVIMQKLAGVALVSYGLYVLIS